MRLVVRLFGGLTIELDGVLITEKMPLRSALLLAYLLQEQQVQPREAIATFFWPEHTQKQALANS